MDNKICTLCKLQKSYSEFYKGKSSKDGLKSWCKDCEKLHTNCNSYLQDFILGKVSNFNLSEICNCGTCTKYYGLITKRDKGEINFTTVDNKIVNIPIGQDPEDARQLMTIIKPEPCEKKCIKCKVIKPISDFWKNCTWCNECKFASGRGPKNLIYKA